MMSNQGSLPVIIAGAGPCGLVAASVLQNEGVPFLVFERAKREKFFGDVGSGFDLVETAIEILENRLEVNIKEAFRTYDAMNMQDTDGNTVRVATLEEMKVDFDWYSASRSKIQTATLFLWKIMVSVRLERALVRPGF